MLFVKVTKGAPNGKETFTLYRVKIWLSGFLCAGGEIEIQAENRPVCRRNRGEDRRDLSPILSPFSTN